MVSHHKTTAVLGKALHRNGRKQNHIDFFSPIKVLILPVM